MKNKSAFKLPKPPMEPGFYHTKPTPPKGAAAMVVAWSFDNDDLCGTSLAALNAKVETCVQNHGITGEYTSTIEQTYASSEYGHCEFELRVNYFNNNPTQAQVKAYEKDLEVYNKAKEKYDAAMVKYKSEKAQYDAEVAEITRLQELELLQKLLKKHGVPSNVTN